MYKYSDCYLYIIFVRLIDDKNLMDNNFPRKSGRCNVHTISKNVVDGGLRAKALRLYQLGKYVR